MKYLIVLQSGVKVVGVSISIRDLYGIVNIKGLIIIDYNIEIRQGYFRGFGNLQV